MKSPKYYRANEDLVKGSEVQLDDEGKLVLYTKGNQRLGVLNKSVAKGKKVAAAEIGFVPRETVPVEPPKVEPKPETEFKVSLPVQGKDVDIEPPAEKKPWWWRR